MTTKNKTLTQHPHPPIQAVLDANPQYCALLELLALTTQVQEKTELLSNPPFPKTYANDIENVKGHLLKRVQKLIYTATTQEFTCRLNSPEYIAGLSNKQRRKLLKVNE